MSGDSPVAQACGRRDSHVTFPGAAEQALELTDCRKQVKPGNNTVAGLHLFAPAELEPGFT